MCDESTHTGHVPGRHVELDLGAVLEGLDDGLTVHHADGTYAYVSPSFTCISGWTEGELLGRSPFDLELFHPDDIERVVEVQVDALERRAPLRVLYRLRRDDDSFVWVESAGRVVADEVAGDRFVLVTRRASHLESLVEGVEVERRLKQGYAELAARRQRFLTTVSHRARTPLTSVVGMTELLLHRHEELQPDERGLLLERLSANAQSLGRLMEEATDADRLSRSEVVLERRVVDLRELAEEAIAEVVADPARVDNAVPAPLRVVADPRRVRRMLAILLGNSFGHAGPGAEVMVSADAAPDRVELVVADDGPGVPPELREQVFEPFVHAPGDSPDPGAGLGLYIVAELAALHGGRAWVDDRPGGGARFHVSLPRQAGRGARAESSDWN